MTPEIVAVLSILVASLVLFIGGWIRMDLVALLVMASLAVIGILTPAEALAGFSSPAVVTIWAVFILSGGLSHTGIANLLGREVLRLSGRGELRLLLVIMLTAGVLSAFMNNVGVAALMLPVVMDISRSTGIAPARLLLPLSYACLLGGLTTLIGTPPNILVADALRDRGLTPFGLFDFTPVGLSVLAAGFALLATLGRRLLPARDPAREGPREGAPEGARQGPAEARDRPELEELYQLRKQLFVLRVREGSALDGTTLQESRLGAILGLNVLAVLRADETRLAPEPSVILRTGDRLLVQGTPDRLAELRGRRGLAEAPEGSLAVERLTSEEVDIAEVRLGEDAALVGRTLAEMDFRRRFGMNVLTIRRGERSIRAGLREVPLRAGDALLVQGPAARLDRLRAESGLDVSGAEHAELYRLEEKLFGVTIPEDSILAERTLAESRLGDAFGLSVLSIVREDAVLPMPGPEVRLEPGDTLLVSGRPQELETIEALRKLEVEEEGEADGLATLGSERVGLVEAVLAPRSPLAGSTLRDLHFRDKYGLTVLAIHREGEVLRANLRDIPLRFGDALLLYGPAEKLVVLGREPDFLVLTREAQRPVRTERAPVALAIMALTLTPVLLGWLPIAIAAVAGAALMVLTGCLRMEEAYREIEWQAVFLIAGMLPLGVALEKTGAAELLAEGVIATAGAHGPLAVLAAIFLLTTFATQVIPTAALVVLMAPIVLTTAETLAISPHALMMTLAMAASGSFMSPVSHPANVLVMGPGGYRFMDYVRVGGVLTLGSLAVVLVVVPIFWPL